MGLPILLVSQGVFHPALPVRLALSQALEREAELSFHRVSSIAVIPSLPLEQYRAMVLYFHQKKISEQALACLDDYLTKGGGCLAVHSASASFKKEARFAALLGGKFHTHGPVETFTVLPYQANDPIFGDFLPFSIKDERYMHEYDPSNTIHFASQTATGLEPLVWTRSHGQGRLCYVAAGHTLASMRSPEIQRILRRGLRWCAGVSL